MHIVATGLNLIPRDIMHVRVDHFETQVSLGARAHFQTVGMVTGQEFTLQVPGRVPGGAQYRVIARRSDGTSVESLMGSTLRLAGMTG